MFSSSSSTDRPETKSPAESVVSKPEPVVSLSPGRQWRSLKLIQVSQIFNALAYACLADQVLTLYALKLGANSVFVGLLGSLVHVTMFFGLLGKRMVERSGPVRVFGISWMLRYLLGGIMALAPFAVVLYGKEAGLSVLLLGALLLFTFRAFGNNANTFLIARITTPYNRGRVVASQFTIFYAGSMFMLLMYSLLLSREAPLWRFQAFIVFGVVTGVISGLIALRIPEIREPRHEKTVTMRSMFHLFGQTPALRRFLISGVLSRAVLAAAFPFLVVSMRVGAGLTENLILLLAIFHSVGNVLASFMNRLYLDRFGARPMMLLYGTCLAFALFGWVVTPGLHPALLAANFLLYGLVQPGFTSAQVPYLFNLVRAREQYAASLFSEIVMGVAGFAGAFLGGLSIDQLQEWSGAGLTPFRWYFFILAVISLAALAATRRVPPVRDRRLREVLNIFFSPRDLQALFYLSNLTGRMTAEEEGEVLDRIGDFGSTLSEKELLEGLSSPRLVVRADALQALHNVPPTPAISRALMDEVKNHEFTTAYLAADVLGIYTVREALPLLRQALRSQDLFLQSKAMLSLGRMRDEESYREIVQIFRTTNNPRLLIHGMNAFSFYNRPELIREILARVQTFESPTVRSEAHLSLADLCGTGEDFYSDYKAYLLDPNLAGGILQDLADKQSEVQRRRCGAEMASTYAADTRVFSAALQALCKSFDCSARAREILDLFVEFLEKQEVKTDLPLRFCLAYCALALGLEEEA
jgi:HEAT repeat protein